MINQNQCYNLILYGNTLTPAEREEAQQNGLEFMSAPIALCAPRDPYMKETEDVPVKWDTTIPKSWGNYVPPTHLLKVPGQPTVGSLFTHLKLYEGPPKQGCDMPFFFGPTVQINGPFLILCWDEREQRDKHIHCTECGIVIMDYIISSQKIWSDEAFARRSTNEGPRSLQ